jgi:hypothetical protein
VNGAIRPIYLVARGAEEDRNVVDNGPARPSPGGKVILFPWVRRTNLGLTVLEFTHALVLMVWVGSLAGFALVVFPVLVSTLPSRELAAQAILAILEETAFLGCGAGAMLLLTTLLMHVLSLRAARATLAQTGLLLLMTAISVGSQLVLTPRIKRLLAGLAGPLDSLAAEHPARMEFGRLLGTEMILLTVQILAGMCVILFAVRRWYRYLPARSEPLAQDNVSIDPLSR